MKNEKRWDEGKNSINEFYFCKENQQSKNDSELWLFITPDNGFK